MTIASSAQFQIAVGATPPPAPAWFINTVAERTWRAIPGVNTLAAVQGAWPGRGGSFPSMCDAWTGACVDQDRGEMLMVANGGHDDYWGNEAYGIQIRSDSPLWHRISDLTPAATLAKICLAYGSSSAIASVARGNPTVLTMAATADPAKVQYANDAYQAGTPLYFVEHEQADFPPGRHATDGGAAVGVRRRSSMGVPTANPIGR